MAQQPFNPYTQKYPTQGYYPAQPPQPGATHNTVYVAQPAPIVVPVQHKSTSEKAAGFVGGIIGSAVRSGSQLVTDVAKGASQELDRYASSPLLDCFRPGCGIQIRSKCSGGCLRVLPNGQVDCLGTIGNDYTAHFTIASRYENKVVLRNVAYPTFHLVMSNGTVVGTGSGDSLCTFRIHETLLHYITFQHVISGQYIGVDSAGQFVHPSYLTSARDECKFEIHLMHSPFGQKYIPKHWTLSKDLH